MTTHSDPQPDLQGDHASRKRVGRLLTALTLLALLGYGLFALGDPAMALIDESHTRIGLKAITPSDSVVDVAGARHPVIAKDSATMLVLLDAHCAACRRHAKDYVALARWSATQRLATRLILADEQKAAAQFGRLAGDEASIMIASNDFFVDHLRILATPAVVVIDHGGVIRGRWLSGVPRHLEILNLLGRIRG